MEWLAKLLAGPFINGILEGYKAKLAATNTTDKLAVDLALADIGAEQKRKSDQKELGLAAMTHPVWWVAWSLFVIPVGLHHAAVYVLSTLGIPPCGPEVLTGCFTVLKVPLEQAENGRKIVEYIFLAQGTSGIVGAVISRFTRR